MAAASAIIANVAGGSAALRSALSQKLPVARFNKLNAVPFVRQRTSVSRRLSSTANALSSSSNSKVLAVPRVEGLRSLSVALGKPWLHQVSGVSLRATAARSGVLATRPKFNVFVQAVSTTPEAEADAGAESSASVTDVVKADGDIVPAPLKTKKLTKQVKHIMNLLNAEALEAATKDRNFPTLRPGMLYNLEWYSPNLKELKVVDKRKARRAKLYYLRDKIARMSSC